MTLEVTGWVLALIAAFIVGVAKSGIAGLGMLSVVIFAHIMPARQATGVMLPLLCVGDILAVALYRQHARWIHLWRLFPWTAAGVLAGSVALGRISEQGARLLIGGIILGLVVMQVVRRRLHGHEAEHGRWFAPVLGVLAGFTTMVANAAGPLMAIYLLAMRLPKLDYVGTGAVFFLLLNFFKVPFMLHLGLINPASLALNLKLLPAALAGIWIGRRVVARINQGWFENLALGFSALAALELVFNLSSRLHLP